MKRSYAWCLISAVQAARWSPTIFAASWKDRASQHAFASQSLAASDSHAWGTMPDDNRSCAAFFTTRGGETCQRLVDRSATMLMHDLIFFNPSLDCAEPLPASLSVCTELTDLEVSDHTLHTHVRRDSSRLVTYPRPTNEKSQNGYSVSVNGKSIFCYGTWQYMPYANITIVGRPVAPVTFCYFDFSGSVKVDIQVLEPALPPTGKITDLGVRPASADIQYTWTDDDQTAFTFRLTQPGQYTFEPNGLNYPIHIFANPIETQTPDPSDPNVLYFGPGDHTLAPTIIDDDTTVYIAGGAVVRLATVDPSEVVDSEIIYDETIYNIQPMIQAKWAKNVTITGRGILCGRDALASEHQRATMISLDGVTGGTVSGIILRENGAWNINLPNGNRMLVDNVKIVGHYVNHDGVVASSSNSVIQNSFVHNADDGLQIKSWEDNPVSNVIFRNNIVWSTVGSAMGIPYEVSSDISGIVWQDSTVLHSVDPNTSTNRPSIGVNSEGPGAIANLKFSNIVIEHTIAKYVVRFNNNQEPEGPDDLRGPISQINVTDVNVLACDGCRTTVMGQTKQGRVKNVNVSSMMIKRKYIGITRIDRNRYVSNLVVTHP